MIYIIPCIILLHFLLTIFTIFIFFKDSKVDKDSFDYKISKLSKKDLREELKIKIDLINSLEERIEILEDINLSLLFELAEDKEDKK